MKAARLALLLLIPWVLVSCSAGRLGREAAEGAFDAGKEAAREWWATEGKDAAKEVGKDLTDAAKAEIRAKYDAEIAEAKKAADEGTASWWQLILLAAAGYPVGRAARQKLFPSPKA